MPNDITGSYHAIPMRPARVWQRAPRVVPRIAMIKAQMMGVTRGAKPPPNVAWRRVAIALLRKFLAVMLILLTVYGPTP